MTPERWERVKGLYDAAVLRPTDERAAFLTEACAGDDALRDEVQALLAQPVGTADFLNFVGGPAPALASQRGTVHDATLLAGRRLGSFEVQALIGRGGMGEVYRAHDTKLGRDVAIKVLPRAFTADASRLAGFEREARVEIGRAHV